MKIRHALLLCLALGPAVCFGPSAALAAGPAASAALPADSIYQIQPLTLSDQTGDRFDFASLRGAPALVGMFYASCKMACPIEIESIKQTLRDVRDAGGRPVPVVLVSFDPGHDDTAALHASAVEHGVQAPQFRLCRPEDGDEGQLAGVLGIAFRALPHGGFSHNVVVALLDAQGRIVARTDASGAPDPAFVKAIVRLQGHDAPAVR